MSVSKYVSDASSAVYEETFRQCMKLVERNIVPDPLIRRGIRLLLKKRAAESTAANGEEHQQRLQAFVDELKTLPVAIKQEAANEQHYEVPTKYFLTVLGKHLKYSSCLYPTPTTTLDEAEVAMLELYCERAELKNGQNILELGCGWGSLSLFLAAKYPKSRVTAVSNSKTQKAHIDGQAKVRGIKNLTIITDDMLTFKAPNPGTYDRVISIEMFEHMKNYQELLRRISSWLKPQGKLFVHIFVHRGLPYHYEVKGEDDWMTKYFFEGGTMPSDDLLLYFQDDVSIERQWYVNGNHYSKTLEAWLAKQDQCKKELMPLFAEAYGSEDALAWFVRWRLFYLACSELFAYENGDRWGVGHYLFVNKKGSVVERVE